jgi:hypothetical protein
VEVIEAQGQSMTMSRDYNDYEEVDGVLFPSTISITGMMPTTVVLKKQEIKINSGLEDSDFK